MKIPHGYSQASNVVTVSAGVATMVPNTDTSRKEQVEVADKALYQAKREGRNRVVVGNSARVQKPVHLVNRDA
jgi:two-component system chemotaxis family response regulator WspR